MDLAMRIEVLVSNVQKGQTFYSRSEGWKLLRPPRMNVLSGGDYSALHLKQRGWYQARAISPKLWMSPIKPSAVGSPLPAMLTSRFSHQSSDSENSKHGLPG